MVHWLVVVVVTYTAVTLLLAASRERRIRTADGETVWRRPARCYRSTPAMIDALCPPKPKLLLITRVDRPLLAACSACSSDRTPGRGCRD